MKSLLVQFAIVLAAAFVAFGQGEKAPIVETEFAYNDWTYKNVKTGEELNLRNFAKGKKLVLVVYFSAWCPNWKNEAPFVQKLYDKYRSNGFDVVGVSEYDSISATKDHLDAFKLTFPVVAESEARDAKKLTLHYQYRTAAGDKRNWGSPWNLFVLPGNIQTKGDVFLRKAHVVNGELINDEAEKFVRQRLGLPPEKTVSNAALIDSCEPDKQFGALKSPAAKP